MKSMLYQITIRMSLFSCLATSVLAQTQMPSQGGLLTRLDDNGISVGIEYTSTYQGLLSGSGDHEFQYGGKLDAFINFDSAKLGLWEGGGFRTHIEHRHGKASESNGFRAGALWPVNSNQILPLGGDDELVASSLYFTQNIGKISNVMLGKINVVDFLANDLFFGGWGNRRFSNIAFVAPPSGVLPPTIFGVVASIKTTPISWTAMIFDPNDRTHEYWPDDLFSDGTNISLTSTYSGKLAGRKSSASLGATYSTKESADLSEFLLPAQLQTGTKKGSYGISVQLSHHIQESIDKPENAWGVFLKVGIGDGNPNPIKSFMVGGIGGKALFLNRPDDNFGLGYFYYDFSNELTDASPAQLNIDDEQGVEAFYSIAITPHLNISADVQYLDPATGGNKNAFVAGIRMNMRF